jgi:hypothetical protein
LPSHDSTWQKIKPNKAKIIRKLGSIPSGSIRLLAQSVLRFILLLFPTEIFHQKISATQKIRQTRK